MLEAFATTGSGDVLCRIAAASHEDLQATLLELNRSGIATRSTSVMVLSVVVPLRSMPLLQDSAVGADDQGPGVPTRRSVSLTTRSPESQNDRGYPHDRSERECSLIHAFDEGFTGEFGQLGTLRSGCFGDMESGGQRTGYRFLGGFGQQVDRGLDVISVAGGEDTSRQCNADGRADLTVLRR